MAEEKKDPIDNKDEERNVIDDDELMEAIKDDLPPDPPEDSPQGDPIPEDPPADPTADPPPEDPPTDPPVDPPPEDPPADAPADPDEPPSAKFGEVEKDAPEKTKERFQALRTGFDDLTKERDELIIERDAVQKESDGVVDTIRATGTNQEQFLLVLEYLTAINSGNPAEQERAYAMMEKEFNTMSKMLGKGGAGGYDPLSDHQDLQTRVADGSLDKDDALELAQARASKALNAANNTINSDAVTQQNAYQAGLREVKDLGAEFARTDPNFAAKMPFLTPMIEAVVESGLAPGRWKATIMKMYNEIPAVATPKPKPVVKVPDPLRPGPSSPASGDLNKEAGSIMEAVNIALDRGY